MSKIKLQKTVHSPIATPHLPIGEEGVPAYNPAAMPSQFERQQINCEPGVKGHDTKWRLKVNTINVQNNSHTFFVAQEITGLIREKKRARIEATGAEAVHRAVKALSVARGHLGADAITITCVSEDSNVVIEDRYITAIKIVVDPAN